MDKTTYKFKFNRPSLFYTLLGFAGWLIEFFSLTDAEREMAGIDMDEGKRDR